MAASMVVEDMIRTYPADLGAVDRQKLIRCIEECATCAQACSACADACLSEQRLEELAKCIRTNMDCADICQATASVLSRHTGYDANLTRAILHACVVACSTCGDMCEQHAGLDHCRVCAEACRRCEQACNELLGALG